MKLGILIIEKLKGGGDYVIDPVNPKNGLDLIFTFICAGLVGALIYIGLLALIFGVQWIWYIIEFLLTGRC